MNINCFQYNKLKTCKKFEICGHTVIGYKRNMVAVVVPITNKQYEQEHDVVMFGQKWSVKIDG